MIDYNLLLNVARNILKTKKNGLSFVDLWKSICKESKINNNLADEIMADFYQHLIESNIFFYDSKTKAWGLRENIKFETFQKITDTFQSNATDDISEKDYKSDMSDVEISELEYGTRNDKTSILDLQAKNSDDDLDDEELDENDLLDDEE